MIFICFPYIFSGDYDAIILASVGLERLGLDKRISEILDEKKFGYAVGQGTLAILIREE
jgi:hydroxymethylbilane synthase